jgi:zinc transport system substrate-binding protein
MMGQSRVESVMRLATGALLALTACFSGEPRQAAEAQADDAERVVYTVNYPLQYFAQRIAGDLVRVEFPAPADVDPAFWTPDAEVVSEYQAADLILLNGAGYAKWLSRFTLPESRLVNTSAAFQDRHIRMDEAVTHTHGPAGAHSHEGTAFTTWLDPGLAVRHAEAIRDAFSGSWPDDRAAFEEGFEALRDDLMALDEELAAAVGDRGARPILASHPVYQYLARRYDLNLQSVQWEPEEPPTATMWRDLRRLVGDHPARWMLWEGAPLEETAAELRQLGVEPAVFDQCGNAPDGGDYLSVMRENAESLARVYGE